MSIIHLFFIIIVTNTTMIYYYYYCLLVRIGTYASKVRATCIIVPYNDGLKAPIWLFTFSLIGKKHLMGVNIRDYVNVYHFNLVNQKFDFRN